MLAGALLSSACGARWTDEQAASVQDRHAGAAEAAAEGSSTSGAAAGAAAATGAGPAAGGATATTAAGSSAGGATPGASAAGGGGATSSGSASACAAPSTAPGVTDAEIRVGSISSLSGPVPGLGASAAAATRSYVAFLNASGGVCGRQVVLQEADDGTDSGRYRSLASEFATAALGIAGGFNVGDVGAVDVIRQSGLPLVSVVSQDTLTALPTVFDVFPPFEDPDRPIAKYEFLRSQGASRVSLVYIAVDQSRALAAVEQRLMRASGLEIVQVQELPLSTLSYDAPARSVINSGADYMLFVGDSGHNADMARSLADAGHQLRFQEYYTFAYGSTYLELAGAAAEGTTTWLRTLPNEEAGTNEELARFVEWMDRTAPGEVQDVFAAEAWSGTKAFFDALQAIPGPITREALVAQLAAMESFDAGGMMAPIRMGAELNNGCFVGLRVQGGRWIRLAPATSGFLC